MTVVHYLQKYAPYIAVGFFYLVKQYDRPRLAAHALRELTAFWKDYAACVNRFIEPEDKP